MLTTKPDRRRLGTNVIIEKYNERIMIVGDQRVGKTEILKALLNLGSSAQINDKLFFTKQ